MTHLVLLGMSDTSLSYIPIAMVLSFFKKYSILVFLFQGKGLFSSTGKKIKDNTQRTFEIAFFIIISL